MIASYLIVVLQEDSCITDEASYTWQKTSEESEVEK
jgi:hypothetical protein